MEIEVCLWRDLLLFSLVCRRFLFGWDIDLVSNRRIIETSVSKIKLSYGVYVKQEIKVEFMRRLNRIIIVPSLHLNQISAF